MNAPGAIDTLFTLKQEEIVRRYNMQIKMEITLDSQYTSNHFHPFDQYAQMQFRFTQLQKKLKVEWEDHAKSREKLEAILRRNALLREEIVTRIRRTSKGTLSTALTSDDVVNSSSTSPELLCIKQESVEDFYAEDLTRSSAFPREDVSDSLWPSNTSTFSSPMYPPYIYVATAPVKLLIVEEKPVISDPLEEIPLIVKITDETITKIVANLSKPCLSRDPSTDQDVATPPKSNRSKTLKRPISTTDKATNCDKENSAPGPKENLKTKESRSQKKKESSTDAGALFPIFRRATSKRPLTEKDKEMVQKSTAELQGERPLQSKKQGNDVKPKLRSILKKTVQPVTPNEDKRAEKNVAKPPRRKETLRRTATIELPQQASNVSSNPSPPSVSCEESESSSLCDSSSDEYEPEERVPRTINRQQQLTIHPAERKTILAARQSNAEKLKEQEKDGRKRQNELRRRYNAKLSKEDQENVAEMHKRYYANLTEEEKKRRFETGKARRSNLSEAVKERRREYHRNRYRNLVNQGFKQINKKYPAEVFKRWRLAAKRRFENLPEEKKNAILERQRIYRKKYWDNISKEKRRQLEIRRKERFNMLSEEDQKARRERRRARQRESLARKKREMEHNEEIRALMERKREYQKEYRKRYKMSEEQRLKRAAATRERWKNLSEEKKKVFRERAKIRAKQLLEERKLKSAKEKEVLLEKKKKRARETFEGKTKKRAQERSTASVTDPANVNE